MAILELRGIWKLFGSLTALQNINLSFQEGELTGISGPNGSGKTTLFNVASGFYSPTKGEVFLAGANITNRRPDQRAAMGLVRTFQSNVLFKDATVFENVLRASALVSQTTSWQAFFGTRGYRSEERAIRNQAEEILGFWGFSDVEDVLASELPHGDQRRLGLAVAMAAKPKILLVDEPIGGMSGEERESVVDHIKRIHEQGVTVVLVEHHVSTVLRLCERFVVLDFGQTIADGKPADVAAMPEVIEAYLGTEEVVAACS